MSSERYVQDFTALEALFKRFYKPLRAYAFRFVNDKDLSEDIVQDVFFELWQRRESIRFEDAAVKSYLFRAVYTHALNALNKSSRMYVPWSRQGKQTFWISMSLLICKIPSKAYY